LKELASCQNHRGHAGQKARQSRLPGSLSFVGFVCSIR
jgi:hypothetical protein